MLPATVSATVGHASHDDSIEASRCIYAIAAATDGPAPASDAASPTAGSCSAGRSSASNEHIADTDANARRRARLTGAAAQFSDTDMAICLGGPFDSPRKL